jgi:D-lactate dehydrogenase (cytochrome)
VQIEMPSEAGAALERFDEVLRATGIDADPQVAPPDDERGAERLFELREAVPAAVNARIAEARSRIGPGIHKIGGDFVVPFNRLADSLDLYRDAAVRHGIDVAVWGHVSDGNLHPNVIPRSMDDVERGYAAMFEMAAGVMAMGGAPLAEHGVGRNHIKQQLLRALYGERGIDQMRAVKRALDPEWKFASGVLFPRALTEAD